jgi:hypothetical protein
MSKPFVRPLHLFGAIIILAPLAAANASSGPQPKHSVAKVSHSIPPSHLVAHRHERSTDAETWLMLPLGLAAVGFAIRRQQRTLDSLQPLVN